MRNAIALILLLLLTVSGSAAMLTVNWDGSGDYTTIQAAINAAVSGADTVEVAVGIYYENINFNGKNIILTSTDPTDPNVVADTIIDGSASGPVVTFTGTETSSCEITGFTITNGAEGGEGMEYSGGGVYGNNTTATISNCVITSNIASTWSLRGGGLAQCDGIIDSCIISNNNGIFQGGGLYDCDGVISNCIIEENRALQVGSIVQPWIGGAGLSFCDGVVFNCIITNNISGNLSNPFMNGHGGGLNGCNCELINCTIAGNIARGPGSGLYSCNGPKTNCIIWGNSTYSGTSEQLDESTAPTYSCIQDWTFGGVGNIDTDPQFVSGPLGDYYLSQILAGQGSDSSCLDAGSDAAENLGLTDFTTRTDEVGDGVVVDMGYHYSMPSPADINGDGRVDHLDFAIMSSQWDGLGGAPSADIVPVGGNGVVNIDDLYKLCMYWLWSE